jgi:exonuclease 3'-5' domain-containing protein 1
VQEANNLIAEILKCKPCAVAFDCEGINLGARGQLTLMQLATMNGNAYVFDLLTCPALLNEGGLHSLLESSDVVKVTCLFLYLLVWNVVVFLLGFF